ncbi:MAG: Asp/Glu racemase [Rhizobiales bacterium PAR1]|nr:MAG: Asp/Glu racemase [Rhizobiales bacterium PAR1]
MRLLCINPNTTEAMTDAVVTAIRPYLPANTEIVPVTGRIGAPYISTRASYAVGGHAALDVFARHADQSWDAVLLACFGEPALFALREVSAIPVIGMAEASMMLAAREEGPFSIVTGGPAWEAMLKEFAAITGFSNRLASVRTTTLTGGDIFARPDAAISALLDAVSACQADGAARVILGGAGLAGLAARLRPLAPLPIVDCVEALAIIAQEAVAQDHAKGLEARPSPAAAALASAGWV